MPGASLKEDHYGKAPGSMMEGGGLCYLGNSIVPYIGQHGNPYHRAIEALPPLGGRGVGMS